MSNYWYFAATLPGLLFGAPPPLSGQDFLERCRLHLSSDDYAETAHSLGYLTRDEAPPSLRSKFLSAYAAWERTFRNELARLRARRHEKNEETYIKPADRSDGAGRAAIACFAVEDPYQAELLLERERWNAIERFSALSSFNLDFLIAYRLRLAINERLGALNAEAGAAGYKHLYGDILGGASRTAETDNLGEMA